MNLSCPEPTTTPPPPYPEEGVPYLCTREEIWEADLIVNATSLGMKSDDAKLLPAEALEARHLVFDMVYRAGGETPLLADARRVGAKTVDGLSLLLHQGAISFEHWFDRPAPLGAMRAGLQKAARG